MAVTNKVIDSHLHVWASPQEAAEKYPYFPGQEPVLPGHTDFLLDVLYEGSRVDGALIVQLINHKFDHSLVTRLSRKPYPYEDISQLLSQLVSSFGANRIMWGSDSPYVVPECGGYKEAKEAVSLVSNQAGLSPSDTEWIMGRTIMQLFEGQWTSS